MAMIDGASVHLHACLSPIALPLGVAEDLRPGVVIDLGVRLPNLLFKLAAPGSSQVWTASLVGHGDNVGLVLGARVENPPPGTASADPTSP